MASTTATDDSKKEEKEKTWLLSSFSVALYRFPFFLYQ